MQINFYIKRLYEIFFIMYFYLLFLLLKKENMINSFLAIDWSPDPIAFSILGRPIAWYGILWALGVALTAFVVNRMFKSEKRSSEFFDSFFMYIVVSLLIGARLGHCLFYDPVYYLSNPFNLLKVWEGGLSSHGGAIGMLIGVCLFSLKQEKKTIPWTKVLIGVVVGFVLGWVAYILSHLDSPISFFDFSNDLMLGAIFMGIFIVVCVLFVYISSPMCIFMLDRLIVGVCIGATFIRIGNLMNSEIYGEPTTLPWGFNFLADKHWVGLPCHPTQIYEAITYFIIFLIGMFLYWKTSAKKKTGLILGISLLCIFGTRIIVESIKNVQEDFEVGMILNMGQLLSIPFVIWAIYLIVHAVRTNNNKQ